MGNNFLGSIQYFAFNFAPKGWSTCSGQTMPIAQNQALFALLGTTYGGNGTTNFALPDLRGRSIQGWGNQNSLGERTGAEGASLLTANMPMHGHTASVQIKAFTDLRSAGDSSDPTGNYASSLVSATMYTSTPDANTYLGTPTVIVGTTGTSQPFNTLNPYLALTCCVALQGIFPSRN